MSQQNPKLNLGPACLVCSQPSKLIRVVDKVGVHFAKHRGRRQAALRLCPLQNYSSANRRSSFANPDSPGTPGVCIYVTFKAILLSLPTAEEVGPGALKFEGCAPPRGVQWEAGVRSHLSPRLSYSEGLAVQFGAHPFPSYAAPNNWK